MQFSCTSWRFLKMLACVIFKFHSGLTSLTSSFDTAWWTIELHGWLLRFSVLGFGKGQIRKWLGGRLRLISCNPVFTFQLEISITNMGKLVFHTPASGCTWRMQCLKMRCRLSHLQLLRHRFIQSIKAWKAEWRRGFGGTIQHTYRISTYKTSCKYKKAKTYTNSSYPICTCSSAITLFSTMSQPLSTPLANSSHLPESASTIALLPIQPLTISQQ